MRLRSNMPISRAAQRRMYQQERRNAQPFYAVILCCSVFVALAFIYTPSTQSLPTVSRTSSATTPAALNELLPTTVRSSGYPAGYCEGANPSNFLKSSAKAWLVLLIPAVIFLFVGLAIVTDDYFVPSLERICEQLHLSEDVAGATFMAAGSSAPELFTSLLGSLLFKDDIGIGTIVGSAVFNILVIIGISAILAGSTLSLDPRPLIRDSGFYVTSIVLLLLFVMWVGGQEQPDGKWIIAGKITWWEGLTFMIFYGCYILFMWKGNRPYLRFMRKQFPNFIGKHAPEEGDVESADGLTQSKQDEDLQGEPNGEDGIREEPTTANLSSLDNNAEGGDDDGETIFWGFVKKPTGIIGWIAVPLQLPWKLIFFGTIVDCQKEEKKKWWPVTFTIAIVWIMIISFAMVEATRLAGCFIGIPSAVMGLTVLAAGTSVPDALASVSVARNGFGNMAVSNAIGSNVFDILLGLGIPWFIAGLALPEKITNISVEPLSAVVIPICILFAVIVLLLGILVCLKWKLSKTLGYILFGLYFAFIGYSLLDVFVINKNSHK